jgi:CBS domain-containing protein
MDVMKRDLFSIGPDDSVLSAARRMRDANVSFLLVCNRAGNVLGTLTDRDVARRLAAEDRIASRSVVDDIMTPEVVACLPTDDLERVQELMFRARRSDVLVTSEDGHLQGVIDLFDIAPLTAASRGG